jgi:hypothetical protein
MIRTKIPLFKVIFLLFLETEPCSEAALTIVIEADVISPLCKIFPYTATGVLNADSGLKPIMKGRKSISGNP